MRPVIYFGSHMGKEKLGPESKGSPSFEITPVIQRYNYDCGQACLTMLGYDGYNMFPKKGRAKGITTDDLLSIPGAVELSSHEQDVAAYDYSYPVLLIFTGTGPIEGMTHWVIRYQKSIYCPGAGKMDATKYAKRFIDIVHRYIAIPIHNGKVPASLLEHQKKVEEPSHTQEIGALYELMQSLAAQERTPGASPHHPLKAQQDESLRDLVIRGLRTAHMKKEKEFYVEYEGGLVLLYLEDGKAMAEEYNGTFDAKTRNILTQATIDLPQDIIKSLKLRS